MPPSSSSSFHGYEYASACQWGNGYTRVTLKPPPLEPKNRHFGDVVAGQGGLELLSSSWSLVRGVMDHCKQDDGWSLVVGVRWVGGGQGRLWGRAI